MERFDFQGAEGLSLNLLAREYTFLLFPGSESINDRYEDLRDQMRPLLNILRASPTMREDSRERDRERAREPSCSGTALVSTDGGFKFLQCSFSLHHDVFYFRKPHKHRQSEKEVLYAFKYEQRLLNRTENGFPPVSVIRVILRNGRFLDIRCPRNEDTLVLAQALKNLITNRFTPEELAEKKAILPRLRKLIAEEKRLGIKKFTLLAKQRFKHDPPPVLRFGHAEIIEADGAINPVEIRLYWFCVSLQSKRLENGRIRSPDFHALALVSVRPAPDSSNCFIIQTPLKEFYVRVSHEIAQRDWIAHFQAAFIGDGGHERDRELRREPHPNYPTKDYTYLLPLVGRLSLYDHQTHRTRQLRGEGPWIIGRSSRASIRVKGMETVSREHARIEIIDNIPFIIDHGTTSQISINGETVAVSPLAPGDQFSLSTATFTFHVRDGLHIFRLNDGLGNWPTPPLISNLESSPTFDWPSRTSTRSGVHTGQRRYSTSSSGQLTSPLLLDHSTAESRTSASPSPSSSAPNPPFHSGPGRSYYQRPAHSPAGSQPPPSLTPQLTRSAPEASGNRASHQMISRSSSEEKSADTS